MKILILEDEQRNAMRLIRLLNDIDTTFIIEGPLTNIKVKCTPNIGRISICLDGMSSVLYRAHVV